MLRLVIVQFINLYFLCLHLFNTSRLGGTGLWHMLSKTNVLSYYWLSIILWNCGVVKCRWLKHCQFCSEICLRVTLTNYILALLNGPLWNFVGLNFRGWYFVRLVWQIVTVCYIYSSYFVAFHKMHCVNWIC